MNAVLPDLERVAFNVAFLARGRIALQAPLDELIEHCRRIAGPAAQVRAYLAAQSLRALSSRPLADGVLQVLAQGERQEPAPAGLLITPVSLEDLFMELTQ